MPIASAITSPSMTTNVRRFSVGVLACLLGFDLFALARAPVFALLVPFLFLPCGLRALGGFATGEDLIQVVAVETALERGLLLARAEVVELHIDVLERGVRLPLRVQLARSFAEPAQRVRVGHLRLVVEPVLDHMIDEPLDLFVVAHTPPRSGGCVMRRC